MGKLAQGKEHLCWSGLLPQAAPYESKKSNQNMAFFSADIQLFNHIRNGLLPDFFTGSVGCFPLLSCLADGQPNTDLKSFLCMRFFSHRPGIRNYTTNLLLRPRLWLQILRGAFSLFSLISDVDTDQRPSCLSPPHLWAFWCLLFPTDFIHSVADAALCFYP